MNNKEINKMNPSIHSSSTNTSSLRIKLRRTSKDDTGKNVIKVLPPEEALKIAAGEVVERPSNIVKETLENSIDAGSTQVTLYIKDSGKELIRIVDNGSGMTTDDAKLCFVAHATSKINNLEDLEQIKRKKPEKGKRHIILGEN